MFGSGPVHKDVPLRSSYGLRTPAHHTITWTSEREKSALKVKVFPNRNDIEISMNGTFTLTTDDLAEIRDAVIRYRGANQ